MSAVEQEPQVEVRVAYDMVSWWKRPDLEGAKRQHAHAFYDEVVSMPASEADRLRHDSPGSIVDPATQLTPREFTRRVVQPETPTSPESADPDARDGAANPGTQEVEVDEEEEQQPDAAEEALDDYMGWDRKQLVAFAMRHGVTPAPRESKSSLAEKLVQRGILPPPLDGVEGDEGDHAMTQQIEPAEEVTA